MQLLKQLQDICEAQGGNFNDYQEWMQAVLDAYPEEAKKILFKSRVESGTHYMFAEVPSEDRCYGVFDMDKEKGEVLGESVELGALLESLNFSNDNV